jgi:internalin A
MECRYPDWVFRREEKECREMYEYFALSKYSSDIMEFHKGEIYDLSIMRFFPQVRDLYFEGNDVTSLEFVKYLPRLRELHAQDNPIKSIEPLKGLDLVVLKAGNGSGTFDLSALSDMKNMRTLWLHGRINNISSIVGLNKLETLIFSTSGTGNIDICPLNVLIKLDDLTMNNSNIFDISCLDNFPELRSLSLNNNRLITVKDIANNFPELESLSIKGNPITDLSALTKLKKLRFVFVDTDKLVSCSPKNIEEIEAGKSCDNFWLRRLIDWFRF